MSEHDARGPKSQLNEAGPVIRLAERPVNIQTTSQPAPATPCWFGEVVLIVEYLRKHGLLKGVTSKEAEKHIGPPKSRFRPRDAQRAAPLGESGSRGSFMACVSAVMKRHCHVHS